MLIETPNEFSVTSQLKGDSNSTSKKPLKQVGTTDFLKKIYTYPPKISIKTRVLNRYEDNHPHVLNTFLNPGNNLSNLSRFKSIDYPTLKKGYRNKTFTSQFYTEKTKTIRHSLEKIPVYAVLNGREEIVLAKPFVNELDSSNKNLLFQPFYNFVSTASASSIGNNSQLGLFFFDKKDALMYLDGILENAAESANQAGLAVHCLSLDCAYDIINQHHPTLDFRFVPNFRELISVIDKIDKNYLNENFIFDYSQDQLNYRIRQVSLLPRIKNIPSDRILPFFSTVQNNDYYKGVPVYFIQYKNPPRTVPGIFSRYLYNRYFMKIRRVSVYFDQTLHYFYRPWEFITGQGRNKLTQGQLSTVKKSENITNYIFFDSDQALNFFEKNEKNIAYFEGSKILTEYASLIRRGRIFVTNLEDFLESWEVSILQNETANMANSLFNSRETIFINPPSTFEDSFIPAKDSIQKQFQKFLTLKYKTFQSSLNIFTKA
jgi:hypothetical protein